MNACKPPSSAESRASASPRPAPSIAPWNFGFTSPTNSPNSLHPSQFRNPCPKTPATEIHETRNTQYAIRRVPHPPSRILNPVEQPSIHLSNNPARARPLALSRRRSHLAQRIGPDSPALRRLAQMGRGNPGPLDPPHLRLPVARRHDLHRHRIARETLWQNYPAGPPQRVGQSRRRLLQHQSPRLFPRHRGPLSHPLD